MILKTLVITSILALTGCVTIAETLIKAVPMRSHSEDRQSVDTEYDQLIQNMIPEEGKSVIYVFQAGDYDSSQWLNVYMNDVQTGSIRAGRYLFAVVDPGKVNLRIARQMLYSDRNSVYGIAFHTTWGELEVLPNQRYFVELVNHRKWMGNDVGYEDTISQSFRLAHHSEQKIVSEFGVVELSNNNQFDALDRGVRKAVPFDYCPYGNLHTDWGAAVPCTFSKSF